MQYERLVRHVIEGDGPRTGSAYKYACHQMIPHCDMHGVKG